MHIGHNNMQGNFNMSNQQLPTTDQQRDLGIIITKDLKWQKQTEKSCKTAHRVLGFIACNLRYKRKNWSSHYTNLLSAHISTYIAILVPTFKARYWSNIDIDKIEMIQRRETKMILEIRNQCYHQLIHHDDLISLVLRRLPGQLNIDVFKYLNRLTTASARVLLL